MVPLARRNLFQDKTRLIVSVGGVAFALLLVLSLDAIFTGAMNRITAYIDNSNAQVWVAQAGVRNMHMAGSSLPLSKLTELKRIPGVTAVTPVLYTTNVISVGDKKNLAYIIGIDSSAPAGGPWKMASGVPVVEAGEAIIDKGVADQMGLGIGDTVEVFGSNLKVKALSRESSNLASSIAFIAFDDFARLRRAAGVTSYFLVSVDRGTPASEVAGRIENEIAGVTATTTSAFANEERRVVRDMSAELLAMMNFIAFLIGIAVTGLTVYTATLSKLREYGIVKAVGATNRWLYAVVLQQAFISIFMGLAAALALTYVLVFTVGALTPLVPMDVEPASVAKVTVVAAAIGGLASLIPIRRIASIDPARVFRG